MTCQLRTLAMAMLAAVDKEAAAEQRWQVAEANFTGPVTSYEDAYADALIGTATAYGDLQRYLKENPTCQACCPPSA